MSEIEERLKDISVVLPEAPNPLGNFARYVIDGSHLYVSGQVSVDLEGNVIQGKVGKDVDISAGQEAAKFCAIGLLARAKGALDDLDRIERLVKLGAFVNASPDFTDHPKVVNGASDLMLAVLGEPKGRHVRFAVGAASLPSNASVEIEALFRIRK